MTFTPCKNTITSIEVNKRKGAIVGATEEIIKMAKENNGTVTTAMVVAAGISRGNIKYLLDKITPKEIEYQFKLILEDRSIAVLAYNLETIMAEKLVTVISRGWMYQKCAL